MSKKYTSSDDTPLKRTDAKEQMARGTPSPERGAGENARKNNKENKYQ